MTIWYSPINIMWIATSLFLDTLEQAEKYKIIFLFSRSFSGRPYHNTMAENALSSFVCKFLSWGSTRGVQRGLPPDYYLSPYWVQSILWFTEKSIQTWGISLQIVDFLPLPTPSEFENRSSDLVKLAMPLFVGFVAFSYFKRTIVAAKQPSTCLGGSWFSSFQFL